MHTSAGANEQKSVRITQRAGRRCRMWQVIYIAPNMQTAERLREALEREGILVSLRPTGIATGPRGVHVELLVPQGEAREANAALNAVLGQFRYRK